MRVEVSFAERAGYSGVADEEGGEEAVHALKMGGGPEEPLGVDESRGEVFRGDTGKIRPISEKIADDGLVFLRCNSADAVDEAAARPDAVRGASE